MKILVTGGAGFIGSHLCDFLLQKGDEVFVLDDLSTGSIDNILHLKERSNFNYQIGSVMDAPLTAELIDRCDVIFHLAAAVGVRLIVESPVRTIETNVKGTEIVLELAARKKKKVVLASTSEVYGKGSRVPFAEDDDAVLGSTQKSRWSYACSKMLDEFLALAYWHEKRVPIVIVRLFNTVGPRQVGHYGMVLPNFVERALDGRDLLVYGDGRQSRCFCHVLDVVKALHRLALEPEAVGNVFNVGSDQEIEIGRLAELVLELTGSSSKIRLVSYDEAYEAGFEDMRRRVPDLNRVRKLIGYQPSYTLSQIIQDVMRSCK